MDPAHERAYQQLVRWLRRPDPRPGVIWVACADESLRARIEERLRDELGPALLPVLTWSEHPVAPWDEILAVQRGAVQRGKESSHAPILVHYDAIEPPTFDLSCFEASDRVTTSSDPALLRLNLGRDVGVREGVVMLLWARGEGSLEAMRSAMPDLWAHRAMVCRFRSAAEFPICEGDHFDGDDTVRLEDWIPILEDSTDLRKAPSIHRLFANLVELVSCLGLAGRVAEQLRHMKKMRDFFAEPLNYSVQMLETELCVASTVADAEHARRVLDEAAASEYADDAHIGIAISRGLSGLHALHGRGADALESLEPRRAFDEYAGVMARGGLLIDRAGLFSKLGSPLRAVDDAHEAERRIAAIRAGSVARHRQQHSIEVQLAEATRQLGLVDESLEWGWRAIRRRRALGAWSLVHAALDPIQRMYLDLGLPSIPRSLWFDELEAIPDDEDRAETRRELHQRLAELGFALGDMELIRTHRADALTRVSSDIPRSLQCEHLRVRAELARKLPIDTFPHRGGSRQRLMRWRRAGGTGELRHSVGAEQWLWKSLTKAVLAPDTSPFHRDALRLELARWHVAVQAFNEAAPLLAETLRYRTAHLGPSKIVEAHVLAAEVEHARGDSSKAREHLDTAHRVLSAEPEHTQPFSSWRELQRQRAVLARAEGRHDDAWLAYDVLLDMAGRRHLVVDALDLRLEQAETNPDSPRAQASAEACLVRALELGYLRMEGRARLLLAELAWQQGDHEVASRELEAATWLVEQLGPIDAQRRAHVLREELHPSGVSDT